MKIEWEINKHLPSKKFGLFVFCLELIFFIVNYILKNYGFFGIQSDMLMMLLGSMIFSYGE